MGITNEAELRMVYNQLLSDAVNYVLDKMFAELMKQLELQDLQSSRTGSFYKSWEKQKARILNGTITGEIFHNSGNMDLQNGSAFNWIHGSPLSSRKGNGDKPNDVRAYMAEILFQGLAPDILHGNPDSKLPPRDAWTPFLKSVNTNFDSWMVEGLTMQGIPLNSVKSIMKVGA